jgi:hypothetical protein
VLDKETDKIRQKTDRIKAHRLAALQTHKKKARFFWEAGFFNFLF